MKTTSYEISKQLAKAGFEAENKILKHDPENFTFGSRFWTYDLETILEALPNQLGQSFLQITMLGNQALIGYEMQRIELSSLVDGKNESLADTAARLLILLHKEGIVNFNKGIK